jgi:hypothetical protein
MQTPGEWATHSVLTAAAEFGKMCPIELLLLPRYGLKRSGMWYEGAVTTAVDYHDAALRFGMVKLLEASSDNVNTPEVRKEVLLSACRANDFRLSR